MNIIFENGSFYSFELAHASPTDKLLIVSQLDVFKYYISKSTYKRYIKFIL